MPQNAQRHRSHFCCSLAVASASAALILTFPRHCIRTRACNPVVCPDWRLHGFSFRGRPWLRRFANDEGRVHHPGGVRKGHAERERELGYHEGVNWFR